MLIDPCQNPLFTPMGPAQETVDHRVNRRAAVKNRIDSVADRHLDAEPLRQSRDSGSGRDTLDD
jgi:hypothetical protein